MERLEKTTEWLEILSRPVPEPDLLCNHVIEGLIAFELVSLTDPIVAEIQAANDKVYRNGFFTADPTERIIRNKLRKTYSTNARHIELLIYTDGQIATPDDVIIPTSAPLLDVVSHSFKRVWFMGEIEACCLWAAD